MEPTEIDQDALISKNSDAVVSESEEAELD